MSTATFNTIKKPKINFTMVPNEVLLDRRISLKAKGLWAYFLSRPEGWQFSIDRLCSVMLEGKKAIQSAIKELEKADYLERKAHYNEDSRRLEGYQYSLKFNESENKTLADTKGGHQQKGSPQKGAAINNTDNNKTENNNTDSTIAPEKISDAESEKDKDILEENQNSISAVNKFYTKGVDAYFEFFKKNCAGARPKFGGAEGNALKSILAYFRSIAPPDKKTMEQKAEFSLECLNAIFDNWDKLSGWQKTNLDIKIINSHLNNIINSLKNGKQKTAISNSKAPERSSDWVD